MPDARRTDVDLPASTNVCNRRPRVLVTLADPRRSRDPVAARRKNELYLDAVRRAGGDPIGLDEACAPDELAAALDAMDGLLLSGGADLDPALYGEEPRGAVAISRPRDELELAAWHAAARRGTPVLGICRGLQAINVFMGGRLVQHVDGHDANGDGSPRLHQLWVAAGSPLERIIGGAPARDDTGGRGVWLVNSFHHQGVRPADLAPGLVAAAFAPAAGGELVEAIAASDGHWVMGVQFHPERTQSTPPAFERLFGAFVEVARRTGAG